MNLTLYPFELPLRHPFAISRGTQHVCRTLIVELEQDTVRGYGEAGENNYYGVTLEKIIAAFEAVRPRIEATAMTDPTDPTALWHDLAPQFGDNTFPQCALDIAAWDLYGKLVGKPVWKLWGLSLENLPSSDYTLGIDRPDEMVRKLQEIPDWPIYKIKLGTSDDLGLVRRLREATDATFRVDANGAWSADETLEKAAAFSDLGVEFIEQPLSADNFHGMKRVFQQSALPLIADESCERETDVERCLGHFHGVNIKLVKCGGMTPARRMITRAKRLGLKTMVGCMTETSVGISAIAQLLPMLDYVDMDGALLLARDVASGVHIERGRARYPNENGCGVRMQFPSLPFGKGKSGVCLKRVNGSEQ